MKLDSKKRSWLRGALLTVGMILVGTGLSATDYLPSEARASDGASQNREADVYELWGDKHLFIDEFLIDSANGADLRVNPPTNIELVMIADKLWERGGITSYGNVFYDPMIKRYRLYYVPVNIDVEPMFNTCLALSDDGIHWEKPELGVVEWNGSKANNIVVSRQREGTVFIDLNAPPERRYVFISSDDKDLRLFTSPDGVHFEMKGKLSDLRSDSQIASFWDERIGKYVHYPRRVLKDERGLPIRSVGRVVTDTVDETEPWQVEPDDRNDRQPKLELVMAPDELDPSGTDLYTNAAQKYSGVPNVYLAFPTPYYHYNHPGREYLNQPTLDIGGKTNDGVIDTQLAVSRDGIHWKRYRTPYIPLMDYEGLDLKVNMIYPGMIIRPQTVDQYFSGYAFTHGDTQARRRLKGRELGGLFRAEQRLDGFVSYDFEPEGGEVVTKPFTFVGDRLVLNLNTSGSGEARVAILNEEGAEIEPFTLDNCRIISGNHFGIPVQWGETTNVSKLTDKPIRLKFVMRGTKLYSFQFDEK